MPTYEYRCTSCGYELEAFQGITADPLVHCPACTAPSLKRGIGGREALLRFQGSGYYATDYGSPSKSCREEASSEGCCPCAEKKGRDSCQRQEEANP